MITDLEADRIAAAVHAVRPDWPLPSLKTFIAHELAAWAWLDALVGLTYVAGERNLDGTWTSRTPARVKEQGPWRHVGMLQPPAPRLPPHVPEPRSEVDASKWANVARANIRHYQPAGGTDE
jgi:hypothetical protein